MEKEQLIKLAYLVASLFFILPTVWEAVRG